jgi:D-sedoheptulose 7-phosphate isomerase
MDPEKTLLSNVATHQKAIEEVVRLAPVFSRASDLLNSTLLRGNKVFMMGNGGSAADAQHFAAEIVVRYVKNRRGLPALALSTDSSVLTAIGNDFSFEKIFSRQIEALANEGDLVVAFSTSGNSENVVQGVLEAKEKKCAVIGFLGRDGGRIQGIVDVALTVNVPETARIQEAHQLIYHALCQVLEEAL